MISLPANKDAIPRTLLHSTVITPQPCPVLQPLNASLLIFFHDSQAPFGRAPLRIQAARVGGVEIPNAKRIEFSLRYVYGIGPTTAKAILADTVYYLTSKRAAMANLAWCRHADGSTLCIRPLSKTGVLVADRMILACPDSPNVLKEAVAQQCVGLRVWWRLCRALRTRGPVSCQRMS